jgi:2,4-dienoyl-CoA reductase-like NADH-dependent reductase (Old Yellow Enzyme family)/thioredoxin reductase
MRAKEDPETMSERHTPTGQGAYRHLLEPLEIGNLVVRNRFLFAPHHTALSEERELSYLQARARGGTGLFGLQTSQGVWDFTIGTANTTAMPAWDDRPIEPQTTAGIRHYDDVVIPHWRRRADVLHREGAKCLGQIYHPGAAPHVQLADAPFSPSGIMDAYDAVASHVLTTDEIESLITTFAHGIRRTREAGLDGAEIHGAHGYLVWQFLSPSTNYRTDRWGGSRQGRLNFVLDILSEARKLVGDDYPIGIRVGVDTDGVSGGLTNDELTELCQLLTPHVEYISVSGGSYTGFGDGYEPAYVSPWYQQAAHNVVSARSIKAKCATPVFVAGRIADPSVAEGILRDGDADMIGMVRALIADPDLPSKLQGGRSTEIRACIGMSECHYIGFHRKPITCAVNASAGREDELAITESPRPGTVVVVGAGPAGMEAARVAALRGHTVYLADRERSIGGTPRLLAQDPNRRNLADIAAYFEGELHRLGVTLMLGNEVSADELVDFAPDEVVIATGGSPFIPSVPGIRGPNVVTALDVLRGSPVDADHVLVVGGVHTHLAPGTIAEYLADQSRSVRLISERMDFASGVEEGTRLPLRQRLSDKHVDIALWHRLASVADGGASVVNTLTGTETFLPGVAVVLACGLVADDRLARQLHERLSVHVIGDALAPRRIMHATLDGARIATAI